MLIDTHCHLSFPQFEDSLDDLVAGAAAASVDRMVSIGTDLADSQNNIRLAERFPGVVYATVGVHPTDVEEVAAQFPGWLDDLRRLAAHPSVVAIGEIGTDYFHPPKSSRSQEEYHALQAEFFRAQLDLAVELGKNVVIHQRESFADTAEILSPYAGKTRAVFHCYTGQWDAVAPFVDEGHLISFTGIATFKNAREVHGCVKDAPPGSFMVETDAPFLAPTPHRGKRCEPAYVRLTAEFIASLRGCPLEELARGTTGTAESFFSFP